MMTMNDDVSEQMLLELFTLAPKDNWTRDFTLYDAVPKFLFGDNASKKMGGIDTDGGREVTVKLGENTWHLKIMPGYVETAEGRYFAFPGVCEELVARALRYLAVQQVGAARIVRGASGTGLQTTIVFTMNQLREVLASHGFTYKLSQLEEALQLLRATTMRLTIEGSKRAFYHGSLLTGYSGVDSQEEDPSDGQKKKKQLRWVTLNHLETDSILRGDYRLLNFKKQMSLKLPISRMLYELLMREHRNASKPPLIGTDPAPPPFKLTLEKIMIQCGIQPQARIRDTIARIRKALDELATAKILWEESPYQELPVMARTGGRTKIVDCNWLVWLSRKSVEDMISAHSEYKPFLPASDPAARILNPKRIARERQSTKDKLQ